MKLIIAGGRNYVFRPSDYYLLDSCFRAVKEVVSGHAAGADAGGERWAQLNDIRIQTFPAHWTAHGRAAGPIRNRQMAAYADAVALFPGGRGTANMLEEAFKARLLVFDFRQYPLQKHRYGVEGYSTTIIDPLENSNGA